jgi:CheY-like chemotaxis protein
MSGEFRYKRVMFIDDNELDNFINKKLVESESFADDIQTYLSSTEALDYLKSNASNPESLPEVIFLDIIMPVMDGFAFLDEYAKLSEAVKMKCKVVLLSTTESFTELNRANQNKYVRKFLNKPLSPAMLKVINF